MNKFCSAFNLYGYNSRSEVITGDRYWGANLNDTSDPVSGQSYGYQYDNIGNRQTANRGTSTENYTANNLNQYSQRTIPGKGVQGHSVMENKGKTGVKSEQSRE